jgi:hypothetical protein
VDVISAEFVVSIGKSTVDTISVETRLAEVDVSAGEKEQVEVQSMRRQRSPGSFLITRPTFTFASVQDPDPESGAVCYSLSLHPRTLHIPLPHPVLGLQFISLSSAHPILLSRLYFAPLSALRFFYRLHEKLFRVDLMTGEVLILLWWCVVQNILTVQKIGELRRDEGAR